LDRLFGEVLGEVRARGNSVENDTIVCFFSDHGEMLNDHDDIDKSKPWQGALNVPLVCAGPGIKRNVSLNVPIATIDIGATVLDIAGAWQYRDENMTAKSFRGLLEGKYGQSLNRTYIHSGLQKSNFQQQNGRALAKTRKAPGNDFSFRLVVSERSGPPSSTYKFICCKGACPGAPSNVPPPGADGYTRLLFDVVADPFDMHNLALELPHVAEDLRRQLPVVHGFNCAPLALASKLISPLEASTPSVEVTFQETQGLLDASVTARRVDGGGQAASFTVRMAAEMHAFFDGEDNTLVPSGHETSNGVDSVGAYNESTLIWKKAGGEGSDQSESFTSLHTSVRSYPKVPGVVSFVTAVPTGARRTNRSRGLPIIGFPSIDLISAEKLGYAAWHGLWPDPFVGMNLSSLPSPPSYQDGPVVFTSKDGLSLLIGPLSDPLSTVHSIKKESLTFGSSCAIENLPPSHTVSTVAVVGDGMHDVISKYGGIIRALHTPISPKTQQGIPKLKDPTLQFLSAWTDNGAFYFWNAQGQKVLPKPADVLPLWLKSLRHSGVNISTIQLDGWWMDQLSGTANRNLFPGEDWSNFLRGIQEEGKISLMLYKAFFARGYDAFAKTRCPPVPSPKGVFYPAPDCAAEFYRTVFASFKKTAAAVSSSTPFAAFETDFLSDHLLPTAGIANRSDGLSKYFLGLTTAALEVGAATQLCMPTAGIVLASAQWPAATNGRVSTDYATESDPSSAWAKTYNIGIGSLLFWAVGLQPSKDITWTTSHQPGGACTHDNPNVELDTVLAVLSCGPVGIADGINYTNSTLVHMASSRDGRILKPSKPLTAIDSTFVPPVDPLKNRGSVGFLPLMAGISGCDGALQSISVCRPAAEQTHMTMPVFGTMEGAATTATWRILVSLHLGDFAPKMTDFLPQPSSAGFHIAAFRELRWQPCRNGTQAFDPSIGCLLRASEDNLPNIRSGESPPTTHSQIVPWRMFTFYPLLPVASSGDDAKGWIFLGEVDKIVATSPVRFESIKVGTSCLTVRFSALLEGETISVGAVTPDGVYVETALTKSPGRVCRSQ
jgi:hypothetical protein